MKNIAVCMSGHPRTFAKVAKKIGAVFGNVDFFFSTWHGDEWQSIPELFVRNKMNLAAFEFVSEPIQIENEKKIISTFLHSCPDFFILNQWYGVKRALQLMFEYEQTSQKKYDLIFRCRFDLDLKFSLENAIELARLDSLNYVRAGSGGSDQFLYGSREVMSRFLKFEEWLLSFGDNFGAEYGFYASLLVKAYFLSSGIPINQVSLPLRVLRDDPESPREVREARTRKHIADNHPEFADIAWQGTRGPKVKPSPWESGFYPGKSLFYTDGKPE